ncbi:MAG: histidinol dehydrogenase, partial [Oscillospiraceae bacterium]|nr:histidinol dehydrogenase [Oscillospiraceae bacterium]
MIRIIKADGDEKKFLAEVEKRAGEVNTEVEKTVKEIIENVKQNGDKAVKEYTAKFDCPNAQYYRVPDEAIQDALTEANEKSPDFVNAMLNAVENITAFHTRQKREGFCVTEDNGVIMGQRVRGLDKVGLYVPGGTAAYPSSVLMNAIPAKIAGVKEIIMVTPPLKDGTANKDILVAAALCGVDKIYLAGGAQAIAALAYGTEEIPRVSKIVGPGNIFVATAKRLVYGKVDIDMVAGPSEILVLADDSANPKYLAADLMSQAEHDKLASAIMVTTSMEIAEKTRDEIERQVKDLSRKDIIETSLSNYGGIIVCDDMDYAVEVANTIAPEHLEAVVRNPMEYIGRLDNVGSLFLGQYSPEPLGDYYAGPNHVLPTSGTARFFSPLGVDSFIKRSSYISYTKDALLDAADDIILIAEREKLTAHANSIKV